MSKLPRNMVRRKGRPGYYFRRMYAGRVKLIALGTDREAACRKMRSLKSDGPPLAEVSVREAARRWLESYVAVHRSLARDQKLARRRVEMYLDPYLGDHLLHRLTRDDLRRYRLYLERLGHLSPQSVRHILADACHQACKDPHLSALKVPHPTPTEVRDGERRRR